MIWGLTRSQKPGARSSLPHKLNSRLAGDDSSLVSHIQQAAYCLATFRSVVQRAFVHVHPDELIGQLRIDVARELHGVGQGLFTMVERVLNAVTQGSRNFGRQLRPQATPYGISPQWQGKT